MAYGKRRNSRDSIDSDISDMEPEAWTMEWWKLQVSRYWADAIVTRPSACDAKPMIICLIQRIALQRLRWSGAHRRGPRPRCTVRGSLGQAFRRGQSGDTGRFVLKDEQGGRGLTR